jgi:hypothetical protein
MRQTEQTAYITSLPGYSAMFYQRHKLGIQHKMEDGLSINWKLSEGGVTPFTPLAHFEAHSTSDRSDDVRRFDGREILFDAESKYFVKI